ncbi:MAG: nucleotidyltransferase family protein [Candidatus Omnitrophica bacterium]|nr:nucleotidyltransferase family protein [Candidatus Omnitrophota bacterium]
MKTLKTLKSLFDKKRELFKKTYHVKALGIFGSYSRGKATPKSDLDMLVDFSQTPTMFKFIEFERQLSQTLGVKVDLVTRKALKPLIKKEILKETIFL